MANQGSTTHQQAKSSPFFNKRLDGHSVLHTKFERMQVRSKLPAFDFDKHWAANKKSGRVNVNKFLEKTLQNPQHMQSFINEMRFSGIDVESER